MKIIKTWGVHQDRDKVGETVTLPFKELKVNLCTRNDSTQSTSLIFKFGKGHISLEIGPQVNVMVFASPNESAKLNMRLSI